MPLETHPGRSRQATDERCERAGVLRKLPGTGIACCEVHGVEPALRIGEVELLRIEVRPGAGCGLDDPGLRALRRARSARTRRGSTRGACDARRRSRARVVRMPPRHRLRTPR